jgi:hypothetical protein
MNNERSLAKEITEGFEALKSMRNNEPVAWIDTESNISMIGGIYPKKLEEYLNSLEARIKELEAILRKAQEK